MTLTLEPKVAPRLGPTPMLVPLVQTYILGDFMRAFGIDEEVIRTAQSGYSAGDFRGIDIKGYNGAGHPEEISSIDFREVDRTASLMVDSASTTSVTGQISKRLERTMVQSAATMRRRGLRIGYSYNFTAKGNADYHNTLARYGLVSGQPDALPPGTAHRQVYQVHHRPTGAVVSHHSLRRIG